MQENHTFPSIPTLDFKLTSQLIRDLLYGLNENVSNLSAPDSAYAILLGVKLCSTKNCKRLLDLARAYYREYPIHVRQKNLL